MKIIYYSPHPTHDLVSEVGYSTHQRETIAAMELLGHDVFPVIMGGTEKSVVERYHEGIRQKATWKKLLLEILPKFLINGLKDLKLIRHDRKAAAELEKSILRFGPDLVYERGEYMQDGGVMLSKKYGIRHFLEINAPAVEEMRAFEGPSILHFLGHKKENNKIQNTQRIIVVSTALKKYIKSRYKPKAEIMVIPNGVNPKSLLVEEGAGAEIRKQLNWEGKVVFGFVGSIFPHHGIEKCIRAFAKVKEENSDARLCIVGDGDMRDEYEKLAKALLPENSFYFMGKVPHQRAISCIDFFDYCVMPDSNWYGSPVKILEYGWVGKPILAPDLAPLRDLMDDGVDGYLVKPETGFIADAMVRALRNPEISKQYGLHFQQKIKDNFTWEQLTRRILSN